MSETLLEYRWINAGSPNINLSDWLNGKIQTYFLSIQNCILITYYL